MGVGAFLFGGGARGLPAGCVGHLGIFGQGFRAHHQRFAGAALRQPQIRSCERPRRPTKDNDVAWVYTRSGLPVEITAEFENWRRVRDSEGAEGWVYHSLLSGRRTAVITMKSKDDLALALRTRRCRPAPSPPACRPASWPRSSIARHGWCHVAGNGFDGWIEQQRLWGVYADEKVD